MGRSIPSFRQLIEIERIVWSEYRKELETKNDKKMFDSLFDNTEHYITYLSFANRPVPIEPIMFGMIFHLYKKVVDLANNSTNKEFGIDQEIVTLEIYKPYNTELYDKTYEKWYGLINSLRQDDRERLLSMLVSCCSGMSDGAASLIKGKDSRSISVLFFYSLVLQNQKFLERIKNSIEKLNSG
ncbi:hypothetical protein [Candidatus Nitrosocosmicus franklandus]|uniref:DUF8156 domain-containing protein n=1 Tax=Candidatus Nitrosocosmicus franklandianus TaxID=1798806 RepID=A0A484IJW7_9ARCH|nr:hypothetical protein [Candidatus Nitrosocosmicus franklandus]VFJ15189.1 conserved protein of unknown function [Candidatus Nitrosocosmicus franklandus]